MKTQTTPTPAIEEEIKSLVQSMLICFTGKEPEEKEEMLEYPVVRGMTKHYVKSIMELIQASRKEVLEKERERIKGIFSLFVDTYGVVELPEELQALGTETGSDIDVTSKCFCVCHQKGYGVTHVLICCMKPFIIKPAEEQEKGEE